MGRLFVQQLSSSKVYACRECASQGTVVHLASSEDLLSKSFHSRNGPAYLFNCVVNACEGDTEDREMTTGRHRIVELHCCCCEANLGWKYDFAYEQREKYKEGKYILERLMIVDVHARENGTMALADMPHADSPHSASPSMGSPSSLPMPFLVDDSGNRGTVYFMLAAQHEARAWSLRNG